MDEKISQEAIGLYANRYAEKILHGFFASHQKASGKDILSLCNVHQVNLFVIRELFRAWKEESARQKSAYFDYENDEVAEALNNFMGILSNHISVDQAHLTPLLHEAVRQTLMLIFNPYDFYSVLITAKDNRLDVAAFREEIRYLKVNRLPLERMLVKLEEKKIHEIPGNEAFAVLDQILEEVNFTPEDVEDYIRKFSSVIYLDPAAFFVPREQGKNEPLRKMKAVNVAEVTSVEFSPSHEEKNDAVARPTLNDRLNNAKQPAVIDSFQKIQKIKESLSINQKFMFTKVLFYGDFESFSRAVDDLDKLDTMDEALQYLATQSSAWDRECREFHEFMEMVEKRFS